MQKLLFADGDIEMPAKQRHEQPPDDETQYAGNSVLDDGMTWMAPVSVKSDELFSATAAYRGEFLGSPPVKSPAWGELGELDALNKELAKKAAARAHRRQHLTLTARRLGHCRGEEVLPRERATHQNVYFPEW